MEITRKSNITFAKDFNLGDTLIVDGYERVIMEIQPYESDKSLCFRFADQIVDGMKLASIKFCSVYDTFNKTTS